MPNVPPLVSVIVAARDAAETLGEALESVRAQTEERWETIVVDDGSTDATARVAAAFGARDPRFRLLRQAGLGVSAARNAGIAAARGEWLLFLDADDWIKPPHLERLMQKLGEEPALDAAYCGWELTTPEGTPFNAHVPHRSGDLFPVLAERSAFVIHSCVVRRHVVEAVGGFDQRLAVGEDWDLWQRLARVGVRFGLVPEPLACYRMRPGSASADGDRLFRSALGRIRQGHGADARVRDPLPEYAAGMPPWQAPQAMYMHAVWCSGFAIGQGKEPGALLGLLDDVPKPMLDPEQVASNLFHAALVAGVHPPSEWADRWPALEGRVREVLERLEQRAQVPGLARAAARALETRVLDEAADLTGTAVGGAYGLTADLAEPLVDLPLPSGADRAYVRLTYGGAFVGHVILPASEGVLTAYVLADAAAAPYAWDLMGRYLSHAIYPALTIERDAGEQTATVFRGDVPLASGLPADEGPHALHDHVGWAVFLQELWGQPTWSDAAFYDPHVEEPAAAPAVSWDGGEAVRVELSQPLPEVRTARPGSVPVVPTVGGQALGVVQVAAAEGQVSATALRVALITAAGYELCRACVRVGVVGWAVGAPGSLRERLQQAARAPAPWPAGPLTLGRRVPTAIGASASRRVVFPAQARPAVAALGEARGESVALGAGAGPIVYAPELISSGEPEEPASAPVGHAVSEEVVHGRRHFERLFATSPDPWRYTSPYEQTKYEQTLAFLPRGPIEDALELACAEGHFTVQLAPHVGRLTAADISEIALRRTAERCAEHGNISFRQLDLARDPIEGQYDLVVCSEVLYYMGDRADLERVAAKMTAALRPGGHLLMAHAHAVVDAPDEPGFDWDVPYGARAISDTFQARPELSLRRELRTPLYRIQLFQRRAAAEAAPPVDRVRLEEQPTPLEPHVAARALWKGGSPRRDGEAPPVTARLPVLMYHRVAPDGDERLRRFRVSPEAFEAQLRYLRDAGYYSVGLEAWRAAALARRPLPGHAVLLTFDDGYRDFHTHAWPLLKRYGFTATVFLVSDAVGGTNAWDAAYGEAAPLLGWDEVRQLQREGVTFGSHSARHRLMTSLSATEVVEEAARSRLRLEAELGVPVRAFCYPYGAVDPAVSHLVGGCGYLYGLTAGYGLCDLKGDLLTLPRIEVSGLDGLEGFVAGLS